MTPAIARLSGLSLVALLVLSVAALIYTSSGSVKGTEVQAEFTDARPLLEGMNVRVSGAVAGTVRHIELTDRGTALVTMDVREGLVPRADASVAIRQQDILGDSFVSLELGERPESLEGPIPTERAIAMPRLDDIFNTFRRPVRTGARLVLTELGLALERRGADLNEAILRLRPGLEAVDDLLGELEGQNAALKSIIEDAQAFTGQAASRSEDLGELVTGLDTLLGEAAEHGPALDRALERLPETLRTARGSLGRLESASRAARPLAETLEDSAPELRRTATLLGPFADDASSSLGDLESTFTTLGEGLDESAPTLAEMSKVDIELLLPAIPLLEGLEPIVTNLADGLFGADSYGRVPQGQVGLGAVPVERGDQPSDPGTDPARTYLRTAYVPSCETFGRPVEPGCLEDFLASTEVRRRAGDDSRGADPADGRPTRRDAPAPGVPEDAPPEDAGGVLDRLGDSVGDARRDLERATRDLGDRATDKVRETNDRLRERIRPDRRQGRLLDYLLGP